MVTLGGQAVLGRQLPASCLQVVTGSLCLAWQAESVNSLVTLTSLPVLSSLAL